MTGLAEQPRTRASVEWRYDAEGMNVVAGVIRMPGMFVMVQPERPHGPYLGHSHIWMVELQAADYDPQQQRYRARTARCFITAEALFDPRGDMLDRVLEQVLRRYQQERAL